MKATIVKAWHPERDGEQTFVYRGKRNANVKVSELLGSGHMVRIIPVCERSPAKFVGAILSAATDVAHDLLGDDDDPQLVFDDIARKETEPAEPAEPVPALSF